MKTGPDYNIECVPDILTDQLDHLVALLVEPDFLILIAIGRRCCGSSVSIEPRSWVAWPPTFVVGCEPGRQRQFVGHVHPFVVVRGFEVADLGGDDIVVEWRGQTRRVPVLLPREQITMERLALENPVLHTIFRYLPDPFPGPTVLNAVEWGASVGEHRQTDALDDQADGGRQATAKDRSAE